MVDLNQLHLITCEHFATFSHISCVKVHSLASIHDLSTRQLLPKQYLQEPHQRSAKLCLNRCGADKICASLYLFPLLSFPPSVCDLQLPQPVLRVPGRGERHHGRDPGEAHRVGAPRSALLPPPRPQREGRSWPTL